MAIGTRKEDALSYLDYHAPDEATRQKHEHVNHAFQALVNLIWDDLPEVPGKTVAIRALGAALKECNSPIANQGE
jgi:hypothetical protein